MKNILFKKQETHDGFEITLNKVKVSSNKAILDRTFYYSLHDDYRPLEAQLIIKNLNTNLKELFKLKVTVCGDTEIYIYIDDNGEYINLKETENFDEYYENRIEFDYSAFKQLIKHFQNKTLEYVVDNFLYFDSNPWMEISLYDKNDIYQFHLEDCYYFSLEEILDLSLDIYLYAFEQKKELDRESTLFLPR